MIGIGELRLACVTPASLFRGASRALAFVCQVQPDPGC